VDEPEGEAEKLLEECAAMVRREENGDDSIFSVREENNRGMDDAGTGAFERRVEATVDASVDAVVAKGTDGKQ